MVSGKIMICEVAEVAILLWCIPDDYTRRKYEEIKESLGGICHSGHSGVVTLRFLHGKILSQVQHSSAFLPIVFLNFLPSN
jgi:hypothetical protein